MPPQKKVPATASRRARKLPVRFRQAKQGIDPQDASSRKKPRNQQTLIPAESPEKLVADGPDKHIGNIDPNLISSITDQVIKQLQSSGNIAPQHHEHVAQSSKSGESMRKRKAPDIAGNMVPSDETVDHQEEIAEHQVDTDADQSVVGAINNILQGESLNRSPPSDILFQSVATPLGATVPLKLKSRIWAKEFIDITVLLKDNMDQDYSFTVQHKQGKPSISMTPGVSPKPIDNIDQWTSSMLIYSAIYTERYPTEAPVILKYIATVRDMANKTRGARWCYYDIQFRNSRPRWAGIGITLTGSCILIQVQ